MPNSFTKLLLAEIQYTRKIYIHLHTLFKTGFSITFGIGTYVSWQKTPLQTGYVKHIPNPVKRLRWSNLGINSILFEYFGKQFPHYLKKGFVKHPNLVF